MPSDTTAATLLETSVECKIWQVTNDGKVCKSIRDSRDARQRKHDEDDDANVNALHKAESF